MLRLLSARGTRNQTARAKRKQGLPVGALVMVLVLALATLGVGYGLWSKTLYIEGTVTTGNVDAELSVEAVVEDEDIEVPTQLDGEDPDDTLEGKDVGECSAVLLETNQSNDTLSITITNGYPSFDCWVTFDVLSTGSVPIHIYRPVMTTVPPASAIAWELMNCYDDETQLHSGEEAFCTIWMHIEQGAEQGETYTFSGTIFVHQYNEDME
jgi:hypothetical protein